MFAGAMGEGVIRAAKSVATYGVTNAKALSKGRAGVVLVLAGLLVLAPTTTRAASIVAKAMAPLSQCFAFSAGGGWQRTCVVKDDSRLWLGARVTFVYNDHLAPQVRVIKPLKKDLGPTVEAALWFTF
jgi:hypothetical protein